MAFLDVKNVAVRGVAACVPKNTEENIPSPLFDNREEAEKFVATTGVSRRRVVEAGVTTSDLCYEATQRLIADLSWDKDEIDCLVFVSQTGDYLIPATACILQDRLGLSKECYAADVTLGCSGWVYGMSVISSLLSNGSMKKGLLLCGETVSRQVCDRDKSTYPLFGDAGTVTALEYDENADILNFHFGTDGSGADAIIIRDGGYRNGFSEESLVVKQVKEGEGVIYRSDLHTSLNGMDVFSFGVRKVPPAVNKLIERKGVEKSSIDYYLFHQANKFLNETIRRKLKLTESQVPYSLENFGNTSSATIPLTLVTELSEVLTDKKLSLLGCGFGVGLSLGTVLFSTDKICVLPLIEI